MLTLIIIAYIGWLFSETAMKLDQPKVRWTLIGLASYLIPYFLAHNYITPVLVETGILVFENRIVGIIVLSLVSSIPGAVCCYLAFRYLKGMGSKSADARAALDEELLDSGD